MNNSFNDQNTDKASQEHKQIHWSGKLDDIEVHRPGGLLMAALITHAKDRCMHHNNLAAELGITYGYINQLRNGIRRIDQISEDLTRVIARFLGIPRITVLMLSGKVTPQDCIERQQIVASEISRAMAYICTDMDWGHLVTSELRRADEISQFGLVKLFEAATGKILLSKAPDLNSPAGKI